MQFFILVLLLCLFIFLYCVYLLAKDDFIFLRRDVTMERLFNLIFIGGLISLFSARLFYALFQGGKGFLNPLIFFLFPYFPGLSLLGGVAGIGVTFLMLANNKKNSLPLGRMSDFFSIAFLIALSIGFVGYLLFLEESVMMIKAGIQASLYLVLFIIFLRFLLPVLLSGKLKEGTITLVFLSCFSLISLVSNAFAKISILEYFRNFENAILISILLLSSGVLIRHENLLSKIRQFKKGK